MYVCLCMHVCVCICMHVCIYVCVYVCMYMCVYAYMYMYVCIIYRGELSGGKCPTQNGRGNCPGVNCRGNCRGNCPGNCPGNYPTLVNYSHVYCVYWRAYEALRYIGLYIIGLYTGLIRTDRKLVS